MLWFFNLQNSLNQRKKKLVDIYTAHKFDQSIYLLILQ